MNCTFNNFSLFTKNLNILFVEDDEISSRIILRLLKKHFENVIFSQNGEEALDIYNKNKIDIIITDMIMPIMNGLELVKEIRTKDQEIPIIVLSAHDDSKYLIECIKEGVNGYILKPIDFPQMEKTLFSIVEKIKLKEKVEEQKQKLAHINKELESKVIEKTSEIYELNKEIVETQKEIIYTMGAIGESRSKETGNHVKRVALYSEVLARHYGLSPSENKLLKQASPMHDIGKVAIPDSILKKPGPLTNQERATMQKHTTLGYDLLRHSHRKLLRIASIISHEHHERYDGFGYPNGIKGEEISIYGRITAVADVFDALGSDRCYKKAWNDEKIESLFLEERGKQFDPNLIDIFFKYKKEFHKIRSSYKDI